MALRRVPVGLSERRECSLAVECESLSRAPGGVDPRHADNCCATGLPVGERGRVVRAVPWRTAVNDACKYNTVHRQSARQLASLSEACGALPLPHG